MSKKAAVPDAWDDDWEAQADKIGAIATPIEEVKTTKAERLAKHAESNKKIWQSAEEPETFHYLAARPNVPLKSEFKPTLKVLARKPQPTLVKRIDPVTGLERLALDEGEDEVDQKASQPSAEELRAKTQREREEKQKRYEEARARIMGSSSGGNTPGTVTPPIVGEESVRSGRGRGRGRGGVGNNGRGEIEIRRPDSQGGSKELFDPNYTPKPISLQKRNGEGSRSGRSTPREEDQIIRAPRGPDGSGRGGFGFVKRGGKQVD